MGGDKASERYAVVSCHVERLLDDGVWARYRQFVARRPGGFAVASLVRPPDEQAGEDAETWLERARVLAHLGPFGHHTHWGSPSQARPLDGDGTGERVRREGAWLRAERLQPTLFCGGGWYTDAAVAEACAALGYADCTPTPSAPPYLAADAPRAELASPGKLVLASGRRLPAIPTTRSPGSLARSFPLRRGLEEDVVHVAFHDTDLVDRRRRVGLRVALALLSRRRCVVDLDELVRMIGPSLPDVPWHAVVRGRGIAAPPQ